MDDEGNALGRHTPHPLICRTVLSVSVCMATTAPHYSFSCCPLSVCWWRTLPLKDLEGTFASPSKTPTSSLRCQLWAVKPLNCCTHHISYESIPDELSQSLSENAKSSYTTIKHLSWICCEPRHVMGALCQSAQQFKEPWTLVLITSSVNFCKLYLKESKCCPQHTCKLHKQIYWPVVFENSLVKMVHGYRLVL